jgi:hypothetical protein
MSKAHQNRKKTTQLKSETNTLAIWKINIINRKQTAPIKSSTQTDLDLWDSAMGDSLQFKQQNPPALPIQDSPIHSELTLAHNHRSNEDL